MLFDLLEGNSNKKRQGIKVKRTPSLNQALVKLLITQNTNTQTFARARSCLTACVFIKVTTKIQNLRLFAHC